MKNLISLVLVLFSTSVFAATGSGNISNVLTLGGVSLSDNLNISEDNSQGYFTLYSFPGTNTSGNSSPFYKNGVAYQVPVGKTFKATKICINTGLASSQVQLVSSTAAIANNDATALTGGIYQAGSAGVYPLISSKNAKEHLCYSTTYSVPASAYFGFQGTPSDSFLIFIVGKEI